MKHFAFLLLFSLLLTNLSSLSCLAQRDTVQSPKITTTVNMIGIGHTNVLDDYISQEKYRGAEYRFLSLTDKINPEKPISFQRLFHKYAS